jgi:pantetheine-phosphate adenylyltransferase
LKNKSFAAQLEPLPTRCRRVDRFLRLIKPSLAYDVVPIQDVYGPTAVEQDIQALVLSQETVAGGDASQSPMPAAAASLLRLMRPEVLVS